MKRSGDVVPSSRGRAPVGGLGTKPPEAEVFLEIYPVVKL